MYLFLLRKKNLIELINILDMQFNKMDVYLSMYDNGIITHFEYLKIEECFINTDEIDLIFLFDLKRVEQIEKDFDFILRKKEKL